MFRDMRLKRRLCPLSREAGEGWGGASAILDAAPASPSHPPSRSCVTRSGVPPVQLVSIQLLRALAALAVAVGHGQAFIGAPMEKRGEAFAWCHLLPWNAGVDLFFVISGFIMVYSSEKLFAAPGGARLFIERRLARIVPLYWLALAFLLAKTAAQHKLLPDAATALASFLFLPWPAVGGGTPRPFYELGWTLNYEMFFYALFALAIGFRRDIAVALVAAALLGLTLCGLFAPQDSPQLFFWTQAITLEFAFGMGIALLARRGVALGAPARIALYAIGGAALLLDFLNSAAHGHDWETPNNLARALAWGLPAMLIVAAAALAPPAQRAQGWIARTGGALGDASYALYLFHPIVMSAVAAGWFALRLDARAPAWLAVALSLLLSALVALAIHRFLERPLTQRLQKRLGGAKAATIRLAPAE
jgi:exopolysaccharide production protein ExoZ